MSIGRILFLLPIATVLAIATWHYYQDMYVSDNLTPLILLLFAVASFGYGKMSKEQGYVRASHKKIYRGEHPKIFRLLIYSSYVITGIFFVLSIYQLLY